MSRDLAIRHSLVPRISACASVAAVQLAPSPSPMDLALLEAEYAALVVGAAREHLQSAQLPLPLSAQTVSVWSEASSCAHVDLRGLLDLSEEGQAPLAVGSPVRKGRIGLDMTAPSAATVDVGASPSSPVVDVKMPEQPPKFALPPDLGFVEWAPSR